ncbi:FtsK/SpoIIIE domain-containing protein [Streptomyces sp. NE06-03C]|uniref:FtsK/SpoIIIE domain-containing protein n=1 Tax=Streptomyces sp. NE06-03C TaxID=3028694 RepID=UPI0029B48E4D|nr:FtsK/SpoIIIE domain-containing protein [Streptomyces sp. NE06-03C]MDX2921891.1 FtsK/SpoIIIE domain-containing protein [Streptomyces sp. NE06-03C]
MSKKSKSEAEEDVWGQAAGAIGVLVMVTGGLAAVQDKLGLSWPATIALCAGVLIVLGYAAWWIKTTVKARWGREPQPATALKQEGAAEEAGGEEALPDIHKGLTTVLSRAGAIGREEVILAEDVSVEQLDVGTLYKFLLPPSRTVDDVASRLGSVASMFEVTRLHLKLEKSRRSERHVSLLVLKEPPFTHAFSTPTREEIRAYKGVPLGHDVTGELVGVPTFDKASLLVGGMTQMGKTTLVNGLITCLLIAYGDFDLYLLDGKLCGLTEFQRIAVRYEASDDPAVLESMLDELLSRVDDRYIKMQAAKQNRQPAPTFKPVFFIIDEAADFYVDNGSKASVELVQRCEDKSRKLVSKSLESGISTIMMTQRPSNDAIPVKVRDQFLYRMCLYVAAKGTAKVALGDSYFETVAPIHPALLDPHIKGQAVLFAGGTSTLIRGFHFPDQFIWSVVDEVVSRQQKAIQETPDSPLKQAVQIMQEKGVPFMRSADMAPLFDIQETDSAEAGKRLAELVGVPTGRGAKGVRGYKLRDLEAALKADS